MKKGDMKRVQILDAAEKLFYEKGYDRTSVQDILDALGMSKGGFYHYFDAKDSVLKAVNERRAQGRFEELQARLRDARRSPVERLNLLLGMANLFKGEEPAFVALMLKLCYREQDASLSAHRRRVLIDGLLPMVNAVLDEGIADGSFHTRHPQELGRLLLLMALDVDDEACALLADNSDSPDAMLRILELLNTWRDSVETLAGAPYGSVELFDVTRLVNAWRAATAILNGQEAER